jgi:hypothetical protein
MNPQTLPQTKEEFWKVYWFTPLQMVTLINPKSYDYEFMVELRHFVIRAGKTEQVPGTIANIYLSQMTRIMAQDEEKMEFLSDFALMKVFYDRLIVDVKNLVNDIDTTPAYMRNVPEHMKASGEPETPPWQATQTSIPETNSSMTNTWQAPTPKVEAPVEQTTAETTTPTESKEYTKDFEYQGIKYTAVTKKNGGTMYYKAGKLTSESEYSKAASML